MHVFVKSTESLSAAALILRFQMTVHHHTSLWLSDKLLVVYELQLPFVLALLQYDII